MKEYKEIFITDEIDLTQEENALLNFLSNEDEGWRKFPDEDLTNNYYISSEMRVYSVRNKKILKNNLANKYYRNESINLSCKGEYKFFDLEVARNLAFKGYRFQSENIYQPDFNEDKIFDMMQKEYEKIN